MLYLVRHAKARSRREWKDDDRLRPLTSTGRRQAKAIATKMAGRGVTSLVSSPYVRCIETLQPTADAIGAEVATEECLGEGGSFIDVLKLISSLPDGAVMCSHGDVIPDTIAALERRGCKIASPPDWRKGGVWVLDRNDDGEIEKAKAWPPPDIKS
jgi:8-oxo-dGTP diphosphatase